MYTSLYQKIKLLIYGGESGILKIHHDYGEKGVIHLNEGLVEGIRARDAVGKAAAGICAKWVSISTTFLHGEQPDTNDMVAVDTGKFLTILEKAHKMIKKINTMIPGNDSIFMGDARLAHQHKRYSKVDAKVMGLLNGKRTISRIVMATGFPELDILISVFRLGTSGVARLLVASKLMSDEERLDFLSALTMRLSVYMGPAAEALIRDAFNSLGHGPEMLARDEIPEIIESVVEPLDLEAKTAMVQWSMAYSPH